MDTFDRLKKYDIKPNRSAGQNFLVDDSVLESIVEAADLKEDDNVLEVGPGLGVLTEQLLKYAGKVVAVELDRTLHYVIKQEFREVENLHLVHADVLELRSEEIEAFFDKKPYKIVANIPYNITSRFIRMFLELDYQPTELVLLVQKEVAERMVAKPGKMSKLAVSVQFFAEPEIIREVGRSAFFPKPAVESAVIRLKVQKSKFKVDKKRFFQVVRIGFAAKRKQLQNNLSNGLQISREEALEAIEKLGLDSRVRAQELTLQNWVDLATFLKEK